MFASIENVGGFFTVDAYFLRSPRTQVRIFLHVSLTLFCTHGFGDSCFTCDCSSSIRFFICSFKLVIALFQMVKFILSFRFTFFVNTYCIEIKNVFFILTLIFLGSGQKVSEACKELDFSLKYHFAVYIFISLCMVIQPQDALNRVNIGVLCRVGAIVLISAFVSDEYQWLNITILTAASLLNVQLIKNIQYVLVLILSIFRDAFSTG
jgi:hypothetical protein